MALPLVVCLFTRGNRRRDHWRRQGGQGAQPPPQWPGSKNFCVKVEGLLEPVVLNLSFRVRFNVMFTFERR